MIDRQINGSQPDDGNPLNTEFTSQNQFSAENIIELTKAEILRFVEKQVAELPEVLEEQEVWLQNQYYVKQGFMLLADALREELEK